jgi:uncharacterized membrane-anchored protein
MSPLFYHILLTFLSGGLTYFLIIRLFANLKETNDPKNRKLVLAYFVATLLSMYLSMLLMFSTNSYHE